MLKKFVVALILISFLFSISGVMAEDSEGGSGSGEASDSGPDNSGSSDHSGDSSKDCCESGSDGDSDSGSDSSGSDDQSGSSSSDHASESGSDDQGSGTDTSSGSDDSSSSGSGSDSPSSDGSSSENEVETEIEHGLLTITTHESEHMSVLSAEHASQTDPASQSRHSAEVATTSLTELSSVSSPVASRLAEQAKTIEDSLSHLSAAENAIQTRNGFITMLFGGDKSAVSDIETHVMEDIAALDQMDNLLDDPSISPALKAFTEQREITIRAELLRLMSIAENEKQKKGLFG
ncbi:MAG: hypothetical protein LUQ54_01005 [Methanoregula sp.]|nr:hypothetical protein [Methanoregula sp.]